jgi:hypothetical protein
MCRTYEVTVFNHPNKLLALQTGKFFAPLTGLTAGYATWKLSQIVGRKISRMIINGDFDRAKAKFIQKMVSIKGVVCHSSAAALNALKNTGNSILDYFMANDVGQAMHAE